MKIFRQFWIGLSSYWEAAQMVFRTKMWLTFAIPVVLSIGLYYGGEMITESLKEYRFPDIREDNGSEFLLTGIKSILVYVAVFMNKYLVLALLAPLLAALSVHTERILTGNKYPFNFKNYADDIVRALTISVRNMGMQLLMMAGFLLITLIYALPTVVYDVLYLLIAFYFYGFSFMDYASERRRLTVKESVHFTRQHWAASFALGGVYGGLFFIPNFGMALEPGVVFAPILGVVAGTITVHQLVDLSTNPHALKEGAAATEMDAATENAIETQEED